MPQSRKIGVLIRGDVETPQDLGEIVVTEEADAQFVEAIPNLFILSSALALPEVADAVHQANRSKHLRGLLIDQERDPNWVTTMMDRAGVQTLRNTLVHHDPQVFQRILNAWRIGAEDSLIADATVQDGLLLVRNCALDTFAVETSDLRPLRSLTGEQLLDFEVALDGAHIHWAARDVHLNLESIRVALDPELRERLQAERLQSDQMLGKAVRSLRKDAGLRQKDFRDLSARQVRRIEKGESAPRTDKLRVLAEGHGLELNEYLNELADEMRRLQPEEAAE